MRHRAKLEFVEIMIAQKQVIFTDEDIEQKNDNTLSYKQLIRDAYKEGFNDAMREANNTQGDESSHEAIEEAKKEQVKETVKTEEAAKQKMNALAERSEVILFEAKTVFPFDFFPNSFIIDTSKVSFIERDFFASERITTILLKDVTDVVIETSLFLSNLKITYSHSPMKPMICTIQKLKRADALCTKEILEGVLVVHREGIDLAKISPETMRSFIQKLGTSREKQ